MDLFFPLDLQTIQSHSLTESFHFYQSARELTNIWKILKRQRVKKNQPFLKAQETDRNPKGLSYIHQPNLPESNDKPPTFATQAQIRQSCFTITKKSLLGITAQKNTSWWTEVSEKESTVYYIWHRKRKITKAAKPTIIYTIILLYKSWPSYSKYFIHKKYIKDWKALGQHQWQLAVFE